MKKCNKCGAEIDDSALKCPVCGATQISDQGEDLGKKITDGFGKFNDTKETTSEYDSRDIENNKVFAILSYIGILFVVGLIAAPKSKFARFHANQGLVLFIIEVALGIVSGIVSFIPVVSSIVSAVIGLVSLVYMVIGICNAASGKAKELPVIGSISILK
mgnify:FL=1